ncbi:TetR/AcrR family transcriptional regulator [Mycobacterium sp.]|uniref:TetR/AcrR family transcriptional regulator n=1 Tax=Mycobacterium sp. TaxID=1785 RepID=UPI002C95A0CD|nr:TetR/AcrR family transcriptional regulator [Mycobacterium sp.]HTQ22876.1 TetR/AcrR family transcriptional regulator [Mycobacterium sp.]
MVEVQRRPGGRSARVVAAVHAAVNELVADGNPNGVTVSEIAERAGVNPTSIYRRWGTVEALILDVEEARVEVVSPIPDTGSLRSDLLAYARQAAREIARPGGMAFLRAVLAVRQDGDPRHSEPLRKRAGQLQAMLDRAGDRGEAAPHLTDVLDCILAPIYLRTIFGVGGLDEEDLVPFVDRALAAA